MKRFESLSIALVDQIESNVCESEYPDTKPEEEDDEENENIADMSGEYYFMINLLVNLY